MGSNYKIKYNVDMVFCIDVTGSMDNIIEIVQKNALNLYSDVSECMEAKGKHVDKLRVRIIAFRDYLRTNSDAVREYSHIKEEGAKLYPYDIERYIEHKSPFIEEIYTKIGL